MLRRALLLVLLVGCHRADRAAPPAAEAYAGTCARCHGSDGAGGLAMPGMSAPRNFTDPAFQSAHTDAELKETIRAGKPPGMPAFGAVFDDAQLAGLVTQIRSFKK